MNTRLLHVVPPWEFPGSEQVLIKLATQLERDRFQQSVLLLGRQIQLAKQLLAAGVEVHQYDQRTRWHLAHLRGIKSKIAESRPDLVHVWNAPRYPAYWLAALMQQVPVVAADAPAGLQLSVFQQATKFGLLKRSHAFTRMMPSSGRDSGAQFDPIPLGLGCTGNALQSGKEESEDPSPGESESALKDSLGIPPGAKIAVAINPLVPVAGLKDAIWSTDLIKCVRDDFHLLILGSGPQRWRLDRFIRQTKTGDRVQFVRGISAAKLLSIADVIWQTSRAETDPTIVLLAMTRGIPVVATDLRAHREMVDDGKTGYLIAAGNRANLARRTQLLLDDASLRHQMGSAAMQRVRERFPAQQMVNCYQRLYESCLRS